MFDLETGKLISDDITADELISALPPKAVRMKDQAQFEIERIRKFWSTVVCDEDAPLTNRVKASELLHRSLTTECKEDVVSPIETMSLSDKILGIKSLVKKFSLQK